MAAAAGAAEVFLEKAFAAFGPRLSAASAGAAFTELGFAEALAVAMSTLTIAEALPLLAAVGLTGFLVWMVIRCNAAP
jgi:hypothetical protein